MADYEDIEMYDDEEDTDEESMEGLLDDFGEDDEEEDAAERRRRRHYARRRRVPVASRRSSYPHRVKKAYVTQSQLKAAMALVDKKISVNSSAIKKTDDRVNALKAHQQHQADALKKEIKTRKQETADMKNKLQMLTLLPLLMKPKSVAYVCEEEKCGIPKGTKLLTEESNTLNTLLPLLLVGGLGGSSGSEGGGIDNNMMLVLALAMSQK